MRPLRYIAVEGPIGAGKTSLALRLASFDSSEDVQQRAVELHQARPGIAGPEHRQGVAGDHARSARSAHPEMLRQGESRTVVGGGKRPHVQKERVAGDPPHPGDSPGDAVVSPWGDLGFPVEIQVDLSFPVHRFAERSADVARHSVDKKAEGGAIKFILLKRFGETLITRAPDEAVGATLAATTKD